MGNYVGQRCGAWVRGMSVWHGVFVLFYLVKNRFGLIWSLVPSQRLPIFSSGGPLSLYMSLTRILFLLHFPCTAAKENKANCHLSQHAEASLALYTLPSIGLIPHCCKAQHTNPPGPLVPCTRRNGMSFAFADDRILPMFDAWHVIRIC